MSETKRIFFTDNELGGIKAFSIIIPEDWEAEGLIGWNPKRILYPVSLGYVAKSAKKPAVVLYAPVLVFFWSENPAFQREHPIGSSIEDMLVAPPIQRATEVIKERSIPVFPNLFHNAENFSIICETPLPELSANLKPTVQSEAQILSNMCGNVPVYFSVDVGVVNTVFEIEKEQCNQDLMTTVKVFEICPQDSYKTVFWVMDNNYVFVVRKDDAAETSNEFNLIANSLEVDSQWLKCRDQKIIDLRQIAFRDLMQQQLQAIDPFGMTTYIFNTIKEAFNDPTKMAALVEECQYNQFQQNVDTKFNYLVINNQYPTVI